MEFRADSVEYWTKSGIETVFLGNAERGLALTICNVPGTPNHYLEWNDQSNACTDAVDLCQFKGRDLQIQMHPEAAKLLGEAQFTIEMFCEDSDRSEIAQRLASILGDRFEFSQATSQPAAPAPKKDYSQIKYLNLEGKNLKTLPDYVQEMVALETAKLAHNPKLDFDAVCEVLSKLPVRELTFSTDAPIPASIGKLSQLESLSLFDLPKPQVLPETFGQLRNLKSLLIMGDSDVILPESFADLAQLESLHMRVGSWQMPSQFYRLSGLTDLDFANCRFDQVPEEMAGMTGITSIAFSSSEPRDYAQIMSVVAKMPNVRRLELAVNPIPKEVGLCRQIEELVIYGSSDPLRLPDELFDLGQLKRLLVNYSYIDEIPADIGRLMSLESLALMECEVESLPESIGDLSNLTSLNVSENPSLRALPESLGKLRELRMLYLHDNPQLTRLPAGLEALKNLEQVSITNWESVENIPEHWRSLLS